MVVFRGDLHTRMFESIPHTVKCGECCHRLLRRFCEWVLGKGIGVLLGAQKVLRLCLGMEVMMVYDGKQKCHFSFG